jgi:hypothetical protein
MTDDEISRIIARMAAEWPTRFKLAAGAAVVWAEELDDLDCRSTVAALKLCAAEADSWPPSPTALRSVLLQVSEDPHLPPPGEKALGELMAKIRSVGTGGPNWTHPETTTSVGTPIWSHPAIGMTCDAMGGWAEVCASTNPEAFRAHFLRIYEGMFRRERALGALSTQDRAILEMARGAVKRLEPEESRRELPEQPRQPDYGRAVSEARSSDDQPAGRAPAASG